MVITGAASGIMEAGHVGAGRDSSIGVNILLPFEQSANPVISGDNKLMHLKYFFTRKLLFVKESDAIALFAGGFGTMDEGFEVLTLIQTGKSHIFPIVLVDEPGGDYWKQWMRFIEDVLLARKLISPADLHLREEMESRASELEGLRIAPSMDDSAALAQLERWQAEDRLWTYVCKDGSHRLVHLIITPVFERPGEITGFLGIAIDMTARQRAELARRDSEAVTRALFERSPLGMTLRKRTGGYVDSNHAFQAMVGYTPDELAGMSADSLFTPEYRLRQGASTLQLMAQDSFGPIELELVCKALPSGGGPQIAYHQVEIGKRKPLPFSRRPNAIQAQLAAAQSVAALVQQPADTAAAFAIARQYLSRSATPTALAALRGERQSPPRVGALTEGLEIAQSTVVPDAANLARAMRALDLSRAKPIAVLCPGAEFGPAKRWPTEHFADLAQRLARDGFAVWVMGSPNDARPL